MARCEGGQGPIDLGLIDLQRGQPGDLGPELPGDFASLQASRFDVALAKAGAVTEGDDISLLL